MPTIMCRSEDSRSRNASTETSKGRMTISTLREFEDDGMFVYIEFTEALFRRGKTMLESNGSGDKSKSKLPMRKSLFAHVPPYIIFKLYNSKASDLLPLVITKHLTWRCNARYRVPRMVRRTVAKSGFSFSNANGSWSGCWGLPFPVAQTKALKTFQKVNHFPGTVQIGRKDRLWRNIDKMMQRFGCSEFEFTPKTYVLPADNRSFRKFFARHGGTWITKPPAGCAGNGIRIVSKLSEIPAKCPLVVQRYINRPRLIQGVKFDMRLYALVTSFDPLIVYFYSEGLVRFATSKYIDDVHHLYDRYMHLTNTSVNKNSPFFRPNDSLEKCKGSMWSLTSLWSYLAGRQRADIPRLWERIKDIVIKTVISAEAAIVESSDSSLPSKYNAYQLLGFDIILDDRLRPWLLEVNNYPSMDPDTPLCSIVKGQLAADSLNLVGFQIPDLITPEERKSLMERYDQSVPLCQDYRLHGKKLELIEKEKQERFANLRNRDDYVEKILADLTPDDVRQLIRYEDEATQVGNFEKIFPTKNTHTYHRFFEKPRYYNRLLDAWEEIYGSDKTAGISRLQKLCKKEFHLPTNEG